MGLVNEMINFKLMDFSIVFECDVWRYNQISNRGTSYKAQSELAEFR